MDETFIDVLTAVDMLKDFSNLYPEASWSPPIYNYNFKNHSILLFLATHRMTGVGPTMITAKADAIMKLKMILKMKISTKPSNNVENTTSHIADIRPPGAQCTFSDLDGTHMIGPYVPSPNAEITSAMDLVMDCLHKPCLLLILYFNLDCFDNATSTLSSTATQPLVPMQLPDYHTYNNLHLIFDFDEAYHYLSNWSSKFVVNHTDNLNFNIELNIGYYQFQGHGISLKKAKINALKKFYASNIENYFEISNQNNKTRTTHWAKAKSSAYWDSLAPIKISEEPDIEKFLHNRHNENNTAIFSSFIETYNRRNNIWSPIIRVSSDHRPKKFKIVLKMGVKTFIGSGHNKIGAKLNAISKFKDYILQYHNTNVGSPFIKNMMKIGMMSNNHR